MKKEEIIKLVELLGFKCEFDSEICNIDGKGNFPSETLANIRKHYAVVINKKFNLGKCL